MAGVRVHRWALPSEDVTRTHAVLVTTPMRTALDPAGPRPPSMPSSPSTPWCEPG